MPVPHVMMPPVHVSPVAPTQIRVAATRSAAGLSAPHQYIQSSYPVGIPSDPRNYDVEDSDEEWGVNPHSSFKYG